MTEDKNQPLDSTEPTTQNTDEPVVVTGGIANPETIAEDVAAYEQKEEEAPHTGATGTATHHS